MLISPDFRAFVDLLNAASVEYLLVGGYAVIHHGYPRTTGDMDIWVKPSLETGQKLIEILGDFSYVPDGLAAEDFAVQEVIFQIGVVPHRIDILTSIDGVSFDEAYAHRVSVDLDGTTFQVIGLAELRKAKAAAGRAKDLADLEELPPA